MTTKQPIIAPTIAPGFAVDTCVKESSLAVDLITFDVIAGRDVSFSVENRRVVVVERCCNVVGAKAGVVFLFFLAVVVVVGFLVVVACLGTLQMYECGVVQASNRETGSDCGPKDMVTAWQLVLG